MAIITDTAPLQQPDTWHELRRMDYGEWNLPRFAGDMPDEWATVATYLFALRESKEHRNRMRRRYYDGKNHLKDFGISTPPELLNVETVVGWPRIAVDAMAVRSRFDGFTAATTEVQELLDGIVDRSRLKTKYRHAITPALIQSCCFVTVTEDESGEPRIDLYSAEDAAAVWDKARGRIAYGLTVEERDKNGEPVRCNLVTEHEIVHLWRDRSAWGWSVEPFALGVVPMGVFAYRASDMRPFGYSRISRSVMSLTDAAVRVALGGDIAYQFSVAPQKYLLGVDQEAFAEQTRWEAYIGNIMAVGRDENGEVPTFGQLAQGSMQQTTEYMRLLASRFTSETNVPLHQLGVASDANPQSAEAIYAVNEPLVIEVEEFNETAGDTLRDIAKMCIAIKSGVGYYDLTDEQRDFSANFRNPAMPSIVSQADAMSKIAAQVEGFAGTDVYWEQMGFSEAMRRKARQQTQANLLAQQMAQLFGVTNDG